MPIKTKYASEYKNIYANSFGMEFNGIDAKLLFGVTNVEKTEIENFIGIYMTPQALKVLSHMLTHTIMRYETTTGKIIEIDQAKLDEIAAGAVVKMATAPTS